MLAKCLLWAGCFTAAIALFITVRDSAQPKLRLSSSSVDFGEADPGDLLTAELRLKNDGGGTLVIRDIRSSCGCTVATVSQSALTSQGEAVLAIKFTPGSDRVSTATICIQSNDELTPWITVPVRSQRREKVIISPGRFVIDLTDKTHSEGIAGLVQWTDGPVRGMEVQPLQVENPAGHLRFEVRERRDSRRAEIFYRLVSEPPHGVGLFKIRIFEESRQIDQLIDLEVRNGSNLLSGPEKVLMMPLEMEKTVHFYARGTHFVPGDVVADFEPAVDEIELGIKSNSEGLDVVMLRRRPLLDVRRVNLLIRISCESDEVGRAYSTPVVLFPNAAHNRRLP